MIGTRGFQIAEALHASAGSARGGLPLPGKNHSPFLSQNRRWSRMTVPRRRVALPRRHVALPRRERAPPGTDESCRETQHGPGPRHGTGPAEAPLAQANQSPPASITERSQL
jgi:hypothetical protein